MENERILVIRFELTQKRCLFALTLAFLCFHPRILGSETLTLTTYYPAPYGGYVALLTTGGNAGSPVNTLLARDVGMVGIGTTNPGSKLSVTGGVSIGSGYAATVSPTDGMIIKGDVGIGTKAPQTTAPNNESGNLDVNDIYVRSADEWLSQRGALSCKTVFGTSEVECGSGYTMVSGGLHENPSTLKRDHITANGWTFDYSKWQTTGKRLYARCCK